MKVSLLDSGLISPKLSHGWGCHVLLLGKTLFSQWLSPTRSINGTSQLLGRPDKMLGSYLQWPSITSRGSGSTPRHFMLQKLEYSTGTDELSDPSNPWEWNRPFYLVANELFTGMFSFLATETDGGICCPA